MRKKLLLLVIPLAAILPLAGRWQFAGSGETAAVGTPAGAPGKDRLYTVTRGNFNVELVVNGQLDACKQHRIKYQADARFGLTIAEIIPTATAVKKGDRIIRFFDSEYADERDRLKTDFAAKRKARDTTVQEATIKLEESLVNINARRENERIAYEEQQRLAEEKLREQLEKHDNTYRDACENLDLMQSDFDIYLEGLQSSVRERLQAIRPASENLGDSLNIDGEENKRTQRSDILTAEEKSTDTDKQLRDKRYELNSAQFGDKTTRAKLDKEIIQLDQRLITETESVEAKRKSYRRFVQTTYPAEVEKRETLCANARLELNRFIARERRNLVTQMRRFRDQRDQIRAMEELRAKLVETRQKQAQRDGENLKTRLDSLDKEEANARKTCDYAVTAANESFARDEKVLLKAIAAMETELATMTLTSPVDGIVSIIQPQGGELAPGVKVARGQDLATIPDLSRFLVRCDVPENYRSRIATGMSVGLRSAALPGVEMRGSVTEISPTSEFLVRWDKNSPKVYPVIISTESQTENLMPGMSIQASFRLDAVTDVIFVPLEGVFRDGDNTCCTVRADGLESPRIVETGIASSDFVEIKSGLSAGETILLHNPLAAGKD